MVDMNPVADTPARFNGRKLVPPPLVWAKDEMSMVLPPPKATEHEVAAFCSSATCVQSPCRSTEVHPSGLCLLSVTTCGLAHIQPRALRLFLCLPLV